MKTHFEDVLGKGVLVVAFSLLAAFQIASIAALLRASANVEHVELVIAAKMFALIFLLMTVVLTVTRLPPRNSVAGIEPRVTAIAGTFILLVLAVVPSGKIAPALQVIAVVLIVTGTVFSIFCLYWLGRSFSVMATARRLVVNGPYALIRHPLYVAEAVTTAGIVLSNWSIAALAIGSVWCILQYRRSAYEESVLRAAFPEYDQYARLVPRFVPAAIIAKKKSRRPSPATM
jgi:protein-S-isoprenylcysteine O-methyltransferase Ste14